MKRIAKAAVVVAAVGASVLGTAGGALANTGDEGSYSSVSDNARDHENNRDEDNNRFDRDNNRYDREDNNRYDREDHYNREDHENTYFKEEEGDTKINANYCPAEPKQGGNSLLALLPVTLLNDTGSQTVCQAGNNNRAEQFNFSLL